ncbi:hypothetical protein FACS1894103_2110 [Campylobacterota bacterium]|nr:hypothetical protein FACS1894103_2110 [Campylobacterota bacterium]
MKYSEETLYVLAISEYKKYDGSAISGNKTFSATDFRKLSSDSNFENFRNKCETKIDDLDRFAKLQNGIKIVLDGDCYDDYEGEKPQFSHNDYMVLSALREYVDGIISVFDSEFPKIYTTVENDGDKPYLLFYKGDVSLLDDIGKNVAVIGLINPEGTIKERAVKAVNELVKGGMNIVSGLAKGCDTIAHRACIDAGGKTIAILPSPLAQIFPAENRELAEEIVDRGGLLLSEYYKKPATKFDATKRFIDRDRLQAMFSKAILLSASYREGEGDSGSRHAMKKAEDYDLFRAMIYNQSTDASNPQFFLNKDYFEQNKNVHIITKTVLNRMIDYVVPCNRYAMQGQLSL